jgi:diguanylate cyclase
MAAVTLRRCGYEILQKPNNQREHLFSLVDISDSLFRNWRAPNLNKERAYDRSTPMQLASQTLQRLISQTLTYPNSAIHDEMIEGRVRAEQINNIKRYLTWVLLANICNALVLVAALWSSPLRQSAIAWASAVVLVGLYFGLRQRHTASARPTYVSLHTITRAIRNSLLLGSLWATLPLIFFADASPGGQVIIACLCAGMLGGGAFVLANMPAAAIAFTAPIVVSSAVTIGRSGDAAYFLVAVLMVSYISVLWRGIYVYASQMAKRVAAQVNAERNVRRDDLTGLPNRLAFFEALEGAFLRFASLREQFSILYLDLNDFKIVNDRFGHVNGDKLLIEVGRRLRESVREADLVARLGGDEFAIAVANAQDAAIPTSLAARIVGNLDRPFVIDGREVFIGTCVGIALAPADGDTPEILIKNADEALYDAKHRPGAVIQLFDAGPRDAARQRRKLERDLSQALHRGEFFRVFQPIFNLQTQRIEGCEALLRWRHPILGVQLPKEFMRTMEETSLITKVGQWVLVEACKAAVTWPKHVRVAVNVSAVQLQNAHLLSAIVNALNQSMLPARRLEIEITETAVIDDSEQVLANLKALRELGVRIALDDFGTGYSSLTCVRRLAPDSIKIDGTFVRELTADASSRSIVRSLIYLSRDLAINVVAEGIETSEQLDFLRLNDCNEGQGYFIGLPKSASEIGPYLLSTNAVETSAA